MIDQIHGEVLARGEESLVVMVGGVGLRIHIPRFSVPDGVDYVELYTLLIVREDALTLFGFGTQEERQIFETLIRVNGVGPRMAQQILGTLTVDHLRNAVAQEKADVLTRVPGVGKKTAQKIILELKDKIGWQTMLGDVPIMADIDSDVLATLTALGYSIVEAQSAIQAIPKDAPSDIEERVRLALQYFAS